MPQIVKAERVPFVEVVLASGLARVNVPLNNEM